MSDETTPKQSPTPEDGAVTPLEVATDLLLDSTIPAPIRKNAFKAFDRLCSALIDVPVGALERRSAEKRAESEARIKIIGENAAQIAGQMNVPPEYAQRAGNKFAEKIIREQVNLDKISAATINELNKAESDSSTDQTADSGEEKTVNDDWLNSFEEEARQKSGEEMQLLFGRILAGEIRKPGTYSIRTVKILSQLDQNVAILFKRLCSACTSVVNPNNGYIADIRVSSLGGSPGENVLIGYGLGFDQLNILSEYGLIISEYNSQYPYNMCIANRNNQFILMFRHQGKYWGLRPLPERGKNKECMVSGIMLSHTGRELFPIVDQDPMESYTEALKKFFAEQNLQMIEVSIQDKA